MKINKSNLLLIFLLLPFLSYSQSTGGFGFRRFENSTALNNVSVSNIQPSHSRNAYLHSTGIYYVWDGSAWHTEEDIDTLSLSGNTLSISLYGDGVPAKTVDLSTNIYCDAVVSPPSFSSNQDNYNPTGLSSACELRLTTTAQVNLTGIVAQSDGFELTLTNEGNHPITLTNDATSTAANRFLFGFNYNLASNKSVRIRYDATVSRWRINDSGSLGTGSGRIAGGRSQNVIWSYMTDTLNDFRLGYFSSATSDTKSTYGTFGLAMDGDGGFNVEGKETYIQGMDNGLLGTSTISAGDVDYQLTSRGRNSIGGQEGLSYLYGQMNGRNTSYFNGDNIWGLENPYDYYQGMYIGSKNQIKGTPSAWKDYIFLMQGGGESGADTTGISMWLGQPQLTDTISGSISAGNVGAVSKERGWGVQSLFNVGIANFAVTKFDWMKIRTGSVPSDTAIHSSSNDGITFYGNKYEFPNQAVPSTAGDTSVIVWTSRYNSFFMDINDIKGGGGNNIYNSDGSQTDTERYFEQDSTYTFAMGNFPNFPDPDWGRGYFYDPNTGNGIGILNKADDNSSYTWVQLDPENMTFESAYTTSSVTENLFSINESAAYTNTTNRTSDTYGSLVFGTATNSNEEVIAMVQNGKATAVSASMYLGKGYSSSQYSKYTSRAWGLQSILSGGEFDWIQVLLPDTATDTTGNNLSFYNRKYYWANDVPSPASADTSIHVWIGNGTTTDPEFISIGDIVSGAPNIYNSNGTTSDNTRTATITESIQWNGSADAGDAYPFQIHVTGTEPPIQLWKGNQDSVWLKQSDVEYLFGSSTILVVESNEYLVLQADSIRISTLGAKSKIKNMIGMSASGTLAYFDGDAELPGAFVVSNGTDWLPSTDLLGGGAAIFGTATLVGGTVTVNTTSALTNSIIIISRNTPGGAVGDLSLGAITNGTSFVINSVSVTDTSTINWWILN